jgi:cytidine deaminase
MTTGLDDEIGTSLRNAAREARAHAYAPYSKFDAGAAVLDSNGSIHHGAIVENISLGLAMCAERVALFSCATSGTRPTHLVLDAPSTQGDLTLPCGACLQVALELGGKTLTVAAIGEDTEAVFNILDLLPRGPHRARTGIRKPS